MVLLAALAWWTANHDQMALHKTIGCILAGLVIFRVWWGFFGSSTAKFSSFVRGPQTLLRYARTLMRSKSADEIGHNPMGGWSVLGLLGAMAAVIVFGLFSVDVDGEESGPLADRISFDMGRTAAHWHHLLFNGLLALIALHLAAVAFYAIVKRNNLVAPMITGAKLAPPGRDGLRPAPRWRLWAGAAGAAAVAWCLSRGLR